MNVLFFDTETTGLNKPKLDPTHPDQPMPVQLGMKLDAINRTEVGAVNFLIKPHGRWTIHPKAEAVHGITGPLADAYGTELITAYEFWTDYIAAADILVAHNAAYDITVMRRAAKVYSEDTATPYVDPFEGKKVICTMLACIDIVKASPRRNGQWKWPKLEECTHHFFGHGVEGAHDALSDVKATAKVFYHLMDIGAFGEGGV